MNKNQKIAVTGANGYIGRHVVNALLDRGAQVIAVDLSTDEISNQATRINSDIFLEDEAIFQRLGSPDVCLHLAWIDGFNHNADSHIENLSSHYKFIKNMIRGGLRQIAVMGSVHEVGYYEGVVDEKTPCHPISQYGIAKDALRRSLFNFVRNYDVVTQWLRGFYIYGDDAHNHSIFTKIIQAELNGDRLFPFTTGKNQYDFIHVAEIAQMISACVLQEDIDGIINCCSGVPVSLAEKVEKFIHDNNFKIKLNYGAFPDRPYDSPAIWGDTTKIEKILSKQS